ncbi:MAG TPA: class I SAM-dependent methyltransferase, partial [Legionellaceae bacterium]|nr:class I SAM-dependent methyltransferase [Legionellaceae bacterium]
MINVLEWPADNYAVGSYIQATVSNLYLPQLNIKPTDSILDIGCGEGAYSVEILKHYPMASLLGIDSSKNMIESAQQKTSGLSRIAFQY